MAYLGILAALVIGGIALFVWYRLYQNIVEGDRLNSPSSRESRGGGTNSLEAFIAAYRSGAVAADGVVATAQTAATAPDAQAVTVPVRRDRFLSGAVKLAFFLCKSSLKDHHVFAHVQLATLSATGVSDAALARTSIDLLVCNAEMSVVAAIDVINPEVHAADATKADYLKSLGIRYLRLSAKTLPKPGEIRALLYRM
jgi:hypothetical protein